MVHVNCNLTAVPGLGMLCMWGHPAGDGFHGADFQSGLFLFLCKSTELLVWNVEACSEIFGVKLIRAANILLTEVTQPFSGREDLLKFL